MEREGYLRRLALATASIAWLWPATSTAEVATDGTLGPKVRLTGRDVTVPARLGQTRGRNLFHSFQRFGIETGNKVTFTGPDGLKNVIARVTGGERSEIHGTLASKLRGADLWLVNPAGILFGSHARLQVPGSFHASTADELRFADGTVFSALDPTGGALSVAAPEAFGFLRARPAGITVDHGTLEVPSGNALSLVGGDLDVRGGSLKAAAGTVELAAAGTAGEVVIGADTAAPGGAGIRLTDRAAVETTGDGGGMVRIRGGQIVVTDGSYAFADNKGSTDSTGGLLVAARTLEVSGSFLTADALDAGNAGTVTVQAEQITLSGGSKIASNTYTPGHAGDVSVAAGRLTIIGERTGEPTRIVSETSAGSFGGHAGRVTVRADTLELRSGGKIASSTFGSGDAGAVAIEADKIGLRSGGTIGSFASRKASGNAGAVTIEADSLELRSGATIVSSTAGAGHAGAVAVTAGSLAILGDVFGEASTKIAAQAEEGSTGHAGRVTVDAGTIELRDRGLITSSTSSTGDGGEVMVTAKRLTATGAAASSYAAAVTAQADSRATGNAGQVTVKATTIELGGRGAISSSSFGWGNAGDVLVSAGSLTVLGDAAAPYGAGVFSQVMPDLADAPGHAGRVTIQADEIELRNTAQISTSITGFGNAGDVHVTTGRLLIAGEPAAAKTTSIASQALDNAAGHAGRVTVEADAIDLRGNTAISSSSFGQGDAGEVTVTTGSLTLRGDAATGDHADITSQAIADPWEPDSDAGHVVVRADTIDVRAEGQISSSAEGQGDAGEVTVEARQLTVRDGGLITSSSTGTGAAGDVRLTADTVMVKEASIRTEGTGNKGGRIEATATDLIHLENADVTSNGIVPGADASIIELTAPLIAVNASRVTSLTGSGRPLEGSGLAQLLGGTTVISSDSDVAASFDVIVTGVESDVGSRLVVPQGVFLDAGDLLRESCAARRTGTASSFTAMGQGGLPPDPGGSLAGSYREPAAARIAAVEAGSSDGLSPVEPGRWTAGCRTQEPPIRPRGDDEPDDEHGISP
jgi:filamentous hemagglutinin family protein